MLVTHVNLSKGFGGGERQTLELIRALADRVENRCIVRRDGLLHPRLREVPGIQIVAVANSPLAALRHTAGADLVHAHDGRAVQVGAVRSAWSGTPLLVTRRVLRFPGTGFATRWCYRHARVIVAVSDAVAAGMRRYDPRRPVRTIRDCVPPLRADPGVSARLRAALGGGLLVGNVGALVDAIKGQRTLIEAARLVAAQRADVSFLLIGSGSDEPLLRSLAADVPSVHFAGWVDNVADYYGAMDIFAFPSRCDALGSSILEAMSFGVPVVASDVGGIPEVVRNGMNGYLVPPNDAWALAARIVELADDAPLRRRLGAGACARAGEFSAHGMMQQYLELYGELVAN